MFRNGFARIESHNPDRCAIEILEISNDRDIRPGFLDKGLFTPTGMSDEDIRSYHFVDLHLSSLG
jgi:hypothetical protein